VMDLVTYETFEMAISDDLKAGLESGKEVEYIETMGRKMIMRIV